MSTPSWDTLWGGGPEIRGGRWFTLNRLVCAGLSVTHLLWAVSLLVEPWRYAGKPIIPAVFAVIHLATALMIARARFRFLGGWASVSVLTYYWLLVKPREPVAEPQSVGILAISAILLWPHAQRIFKNKLPSDLRPLALRLGLAYPFLEWGLDALRNPIRFQYYLRDNAMGQPVLLVLSPEGATVLLGLFEVLLALLLTVGLLNRITSSMVLVSLVAFSVIAGYPLALPQDIALGGAVVTLILQGGGAFSLDRRIRMVSGGAANQSGPPSGFLGLTRDSVLGTAGEVLPQADDVPSSGAGKFGDDDSEYERSQFAES